MKTGNILHHINICIQLAWIWGGNPRILYFAHENIIWKCELWTYPEFPCFPAILITTMLQNLNAQEKDTVTFEVNVNYEGITYKWLKNGVEIRSTDRCQARCKQLTHTLSIRNVHFGDSAEYSFMAGSAVTTAKLYVEGETLTVLFPCSCSLVSR